MNAAVYVAPQADRTHSTEAATPRMITIRVERQSASSAPTPVALGIPVPAGALFDVGRLALHDPNGIGAPLQARVQAHWPDGSAQWLLVEFLCGPSVPLVSDWSLQLDALGSPAPPSQRVRVVETAAAFVVDSGHSKIVVPRDRLAPLATVHRAGHPLLLGSDVELLDLSGRCATPVVTASRIEASGPVRATILLEGRFRGRAPCKFDCRVSFFAGTGLIRLDLALHNPKRARHPGGLWDLGDPGSTHFQELALRLRPPLDPSARMELNLGDGTPPLKPARDAAVCQDSSGGDQWNSPIHVDRTGVVPHQLRGYRATCDSAQIEGLRASPTVTAHWNEGAFSAWIPEFWQQFPKAIEASPQAIRLSLFPKQTRGGHELQGGERKSHTVWLDFQTSEACDTNRPDWSTARARSHYRGADVDEASTVSGLSGILDTRDPRLDQYLAAAVDGPASLFDRRESADVFGWRNYGELHADHEAAYYNGSTPLISHYNNQYDVLYGALIQHLRGGDPRWWEIADPLARHIIDIDIYHTAEDRACYNGGLFWHTDHYRTAATCTHRAYSRVNKQPGRPYGGGPSNEHNYTTGLLLYYYLTGYEPARAAVLSLARWVLAMDDGTRTPLGLIDRGPTGKATNTLDPCYHGPGRGAGNSINALLDAWLLTRSNDYKQAAEELIARCIHPHDDIDAHQLMDTERRWSYTVFLSVLDRYLRLKAQAGELDARYAYGAASLRAYGRWMLAHESPYFDRPDQLEFPTETWAAQDLRKANVLRLAAAYEDPAQAPAMIDRGNAIAERAWSDLLNFPTRYVTRAIALVLREGPIDALLRRGSPSPMPRPRVAQNFGAPVRFQNQKARVLRTLRNPFTILRRGAD